MKKFTKIASLALTAVMAATCLAGCGAGSSTSTSGSASGDKKVIKIGGIGPLTGAAAIYGQAVKNGAEIAIDEINSKGDLKFELKFEDDENDAEKAVNAYNNLKDWGMQVSMGTVTTQPCIAVSAESNSDGMFALTPSSSAPDVVKDKDFMFQMCFSDPNQGVASAKYIKEQNLGEKIAIIYNNSDVYSTGIYQKFTSEAQSQGLNVVCVKTFTDDSANDFTSQLNEIKAAGADLVYLPIYYTPASLILTQAKKMQYEPKFFGVDGMDGILTLEGFDKSLAEDVMLLTPFTADAQDEATKSFVKKYNDKYKETPNQFAADGYDVVNAIYEACKKAGITGDMTSEEIGKKLVDTFTSADFKIDGITGTGMTWSKDGEVSKEPKGMKIKNGAYVGM